MSLFSLIGGLGRDREVAAGTHLFFQGQPDANMYLLKAGHLKAYYVSSEGREHVKSLLGPGTAIGSIAALTEGGDCTFGVVAEGDAVVREIAFADLRAKAAEDHDVALALVDFLVAFAKKKERREYELLSLSAADRQAAALREVEGYDGVFRQADIAAYIGVTPQAFSRLKKRRAEADIKA